MMWDERFGGDDYLYGTAPNDFLAAHAERLPPGRVLSLAEGEGRNAVFLAGRGHEVVAVDGSAVGLAKATRLATSRGVTIETVHADLAVYDPGEGTFDAVVSVFCHVPPAVRAPMYERAVRALRPGGVLLLEAYTPAQLRHGTGGPRDPALLVPLEALRRELAGLVLEVAREVERDVIEGTGHTGLAAVVQVVGRRS